MIVFVAVAVAMAPPSPTLSPSLSLSMTLLSATGLSTVLLPAVELSAAIFSADELPATLLSAAGLLSCVILYVYCAATATLPSVAVLLSPVDADAEPPTTMVIISTFEFLSAVLLSLSATHPSAILLVSSPSSAGLSLTILSYSSTVSAAESEV